MLPLSFSFLTIKFGIWMKKPLRNWTTVDQIRNSGDCDECNNYCYLVVCRYIQRSRSSVIFEADEWSAISNVSSPINGRFVSRFSLKGLINYKSVLSARSCLVLTRTKCTSNRDQLRLASRTALADTTIFFAEKNISCLVDRKKTYNISRKFANRQPLHFLFFFSSLAC